MMQMTTYTSYVEYISKQVRCLASQLSDEAEELVKVANEIEQGQRSYFNIFRSKAALKEAEKPSPYWKQRLSNRALVSQNGVMSRTKHLIQKLCEAPTNSVKLRRGEELCHHLLQFPEARSVAIKNGGEGKLCRIIQLTRDEEVVLVLRKCLLLLGHSHPTRGNGIRILSIDGGGLRGLVALEALKRMEEKTGKRTYELFDLICGVSVGSILAILLGALKKSTEEAERILKGVGREVFQPWSWKSTGSVLWNHSLYNTKVWDQLLQRELGDVNLIDTAADPFVPKVALVSAVVNMGKLKSFVFRNYMPPHRAQSRYMGSCSVRLWEACRASAAAPGYFEEFTLGDLIHQDGGILMNNPCGIALHEARLLWPNSPLECVVSLGTGKSQSHDNTLPSPSPTSIKRKLLLVLDSAADTEGVHVMLQDLIPGHIYFRLNPYLRELVDLDETSEEKFLQMQEDTIMYLRRNDHLLERAAAILLREKSVSTRLHDWLLLQRLILTKT
ncbi:unnamed protein product [Darwinula stevensoni]|uniref:PNPLA domain-containing protein n=1 Tax=Darwinula stevensoni TaxID=69355 RepID=A0A7R8X045_9CRUS|nr:unnamed protein product [Darwinula stevensoni]CAG0880810.1 unnamed protein product [Darwinula stevensoni]